MIKLSLACWSLAYFVLYLHALLAIFSHLSTLTQLIASTIVSAASLEDLKCASNTDIHIAVPAHMIVVLAEIIRIVAKCMETTNNIKSVQHKALLGGYFTALALFVSLL
jgi:hypothetical protein